MNLQIQTYPRDPEPNDSSLVDAPAAPPAEQQASKPRAAAPPAKVVRAFAAESRGLDAAQRFVDLALTTTLLVLLMPFFLLIGLIVKLDSRGPILFKQKRVGRHGREFWFYKFRSMVADAEQRRQALAQHNEASGPLFKMKKDPRLTRSGRWLRRFSLDELPQLLNVQINDMSLVGPRPALPAEVIKYTPVQRLRLAVPPGLTGLWQVSGRSDLDFEQSIALDLQFVENRSLLLYVKILLMTIPAVTTGKGAY